jgi:hypothetical protein
VRIAAIASIVILGLATAGIASAKTPQRTTLTGKISVLEVKTITVHGSRNLTCRITPASPRLRGFRLGARARITCVEGVLASIAKPLTVTVMPEPMPNDSPGSGTGATKVAPTVNGSGTITLLTATSVEFNTDISCLLNASSPSVARFRVGSNVSYTCTGGTLTSIGTSEAA